MGTSRLWIAVSLAIGCFVAHAFADRGSLPQAEDYSIEFGSSTDTGGSLQEVISEADSVIQAKALTSSMRYGSPLDAELLPNRRLILRDYSFEAIRVFKGALQRTTITVSVIGGRSVKGVPEPLGPPTFIAGREYILLLCQKEDKEVFWLTRGLSSAFDITDAKVQPLGASVSARGQRSVTRDRLLQRVAAYSKRKSTPRQIGYGCGWN